MTDSLTSTMESKRFNNRSKIYNNSNADNCNNDEVIKVDQNNNYDYGRRIWKRPTAIPPCPLGGGGEQQQLPSMFSAALLMSLPVANRSGNKNRTPSYLSKRSTMKKEDVDNDDDDDPELNIPPAYKAAMTRTTKTSRTKKRTNAEQKYNDKEPQNNRSIVTETPMTSKKNDRNSITAAFLKSKNNNTDSATETNNCIDLMTVKQRIELVRAFHELQREEEEEMMTRNAKPIDVKLTDDVLNVLRTVKTENNQFISKVNKREENDDDGGGGDLSSSSSSSSSSSWTASIYSTMTDSDDDDYNSDDYLI